MLASRSRHERVFGGRLGAGWPHRRAAASSWQQRIVRSACKLWPMLFLYKTLMSFNGVTKLGQACNHMCITSGPYFVWLMGTPVSLRAAYSLGDPVQRWGANPPHTPWITTRESLAHRAFVKNMSVASVQISGLQFANEDINILWLNMTLHQSKAITGSAGK